MYRFKKLEFSRLDPEEQARRARDFHELMRRRRTVRDFSPEPVPREIIDLAVQTAGTAPSGANQQPWRFVIVGDAGIKKKIRLAAEEEERENYSGRFPDDWLQVLAPLGTDWRKEFLEIAPWLIVVFKIDYGISPDGGKIKHYYVNESVGIASGMLLAALHNAGLATLTHTPNPMGFLTEILERPKNEKPFLLIPTGYPADGAEVPDISRKPFDEIAAIFD
ncbi:MAG: nitroreductase family protein [Blastocatellales bacterium]